MKKEYYFEINPYLIFRCDSDTFPFHLYVYNPYNNVYSIFLSSNSLFTQHKKSDLETILTRGGILKVKYTQKKIFSLFYGIADEFLPPNNIIKDELIELQEKNLADFKAKYNSENNSDLIRIAKTAITDNNFLSLAKYIKEYISTFKFTNSPTCSLTIQLSTKLLNDDSLTCRTACLSFTIAILHGIKNEIELCQLVCAAFFHNLGLSLVPADISSKPYMNLNENEREKYHRHPYFSKHILRKSGVTIDERVLSIITEHHERYDGKGYPDKKNRRFIDPLAQILGLSSHVVEYSAGLISGEKRSVSYVINQIYTRELSDGLELNFNDDLISILGIIYSNEDLLKVVNS